MIFKSFKFRIVYRLIILSSLLGGVFYFVFVTEQYLRSAYFIVFFIISVVELFWFIDRTNRDLANFFQSILQNDFTTTFTKKHKGKTFVQLYDSINKITEKFREIGAEKEAQFLFLEMLIQHVKVAIVSFDEHGTVRLCNDSFYQIIDTKYVKDLNQLKKSFPDLVLQLEEIQPEKPIVYKLQTENEILHLTILANVFIMEGKTFKLVSLQNIKNELEAGEVDAWQKLIRVLTHEIMNSVTPITSLTDTLLDIVSPNYENKSPLEDQQIENIYAGLKAIKDRNQGLNTFTKAYRSLTRVPVPTFSKIDGEEFVQSLHILMTPDLEAKGIALHSAVEPVGYTFNGDREQLVQVVINLIKNAAEAFEATADKNISVTITGGKNTKIAVSDNGPGIPEEYHDKIFIPFFTTKKKGSGIGLALARQVIHLHNGKLDMDTGEDGTNFNITL